MAAAGMPAGDPLAAVAGYSHIYTLARTLVLLAVDSLILPASLLQLHEGRNGCRATEQDAHVRWHAQRGEVTQVPGLDRGGITL